MEAGARRAQSARQQAQIPRPTTTTSSGGFLPFGWGGTSASQLPLDEWGSHVLILRAREKDTCRPGRSEAAKRSCFTRTDWFSARPTRQSQQCTSRTHLKHSRHDAARSSTRHGEQSPPLGSMLEREAAHTRQHTRTHTLTVPLFFHEINKFPAHKTSTAEACTLTATRAAARRRY